MIRYHRIVIVKSIDLENRRPMKRSCARLFLIAITVLHLTSFAAENRPRVIVTTDGEADDRCSMVRFLLTCNEFEVEGIINSSSQFHWVGGTGWNAFHPVTWVKDYIDLYAKVYDNLRLHDPDYPTPAYLLSQWKVGNINGIGEMTERTDGAAHIANVLLDETDPRPVWVQAWGGCNTIARALKIIQEDHPDKMPQVAAKMRLYLIWEQDETYQSYIRPNWERFNIPTIITDQFDCMAYIWPKVLPDPPKRYFEREFMATIVTGHGPLCDAYEDNNGAFNAEGDTPAFLYTIPTGLRSDTSPDWGGWGGRFVKVRNNVWMDPVPDETFTHPTGQWGFSNSWSKQLEHRTDPVGVQIRTHYFKPIWRWLDAVQNDFAARADWCVKPYANANHHPVVKLAHACDLNAKPGATVTLSAKGTTDPDGDALSYRWWQYAEADTYEGAVVMDNPKSIATSLTVPKDAQPGQTIHAVCEVTDDDTPPLTRYQRVVITVDPGH